MPMARTQPSDHQTFPWLSSAILWGVRLLGSVARIRYSEIVLPVAVSIDAMRAMALLFSVNQTSDGVTGSFAAIPYGLLLPVGVGKSTNACVTGSKRPTAETRCSVYQIFPWLNV